MVQTAWANQAAEEPLFIDVAREVRVSALLRRPPDARVLFVIGHGAGAGMRHPFLAGLAADLAARSIASLRYQYPYMERRARRPDAPAVCHATTRAAVALAVDIEPHLPLIAGGKSFGGRMTSQAQALDPLSHVRGLAFLGFPLHPAKKPSLARADHLSNVGIPMLFLQGSRDDLADPLLMREAIARLGEQATMVAIDGADHGFHVRARAGRTDAEVLCEIGDAIDAWLGSALGIPRR